MEQECTGLLAGGRDGLMLRHCVNPDCRVPLHSLSEGRLYQFEIVSISIAACDSDGSTFDEKPVREAVHYWLCGQCAGSFELRMEPLQGLRMVPLEAGRESANSRLADEVFEHGNRC